MSRADLDMRCHGRFLQSVNKLAAPEAKKEDRV